MARHPAMIAQVLFLVAACGGGDKKVTKKPVVEKPDAPPAKETEADRENKRLDAARDIVPEGSACLPPGLKAEGAPRLELAAVGKDAIVCAVDTDDERLLGPVGCWKINLLTGALDYQAPAPLPGHGFSVNMDERCARGYCLPTEAKAASGKSAHMAWNSDGSKVAVLVGEEVHIFAAGSKAYEKSFSIRGDKGVTLEPSALHWVGDVVFVEGTDTGPFAAVWAFKADGTPIGPIEAIGSKDGKPLSTFGGSFSLLDKNRVAVAEQGFSTLTIYDVSTGARAKLVRKLTKPPCKPAELEAYWKQNEGVGAKCKNHMDKNFSHLVGATAVAGSKSLLVLLRGARTGELGVYDAKTLAEKSVIKMPWCEGGGGGEAKSGDGGAADDDKEADKAPEKSKKRAPAKTGAGDEDPDAGGE